MSANINATNIGQPPEPDPFHSQACAEVGAVFDSIPAEIMEAMDDAFGIEWYAIGQASWIARRADFLRTESE